MAGRAESQTIQGFGLQIGNDFYLLFDPTTRRHLDELAAKLSSTVSLTGVWLADNGTTNDTGVPLNGTWTFTHTILPKEQDIISACYRPARFPWYLQPFPLWSSFIIVPLFSTLSSLANLQPLRSKQLIVMVVISCCSYASNKIANHYIFNRSDVVSAIGAFTVGLLGNAYSRKMGGTAFTSMVTGVLLMVPVSCSPLPLEWNSNRNHCPLVGPFTGRRDHRKWQWNRYRRRNDRCDDRNHCWVVYEPSTSVYLRVKEECCRVFLLKQMVHKNLHLE